MLYMHTCVKHFFIFTSFAVDKIKITVYNEDK